MPVTIPYRRYSTNTRTGGSAARCARCVQRAGMPAADIDGLSLSSFTVGPDTAIGLTQHLGLTPRWLDHVPLGGASGVVALRRAARAVQCGDAEFVACVAGDTNQVDSFRRMLSTFSRFAQDAVYPYGSGGAERELRADHPQLHEALRRHARGFRQDLRRAARQCAEIPHALMKKPLTLDEYLGARAISDPHPSLRLRHALRRRRGLPGLPRGRGEVARACRRRASSPPSSGTTPFPTIRSSIAAAG